MKKLLAVIFSAVVLAVSSFAIAGCGCSNSGTSEEPATDLVGDWGGRSDDVEAEFNDDGTCVIGGITGTYEIDENNTLTVTPNSDGETQSEPLVFEYYNDDDTSAIQQNQWTIADNKLYINGYQYTDVSIDTPEAENADNGNADIGSNTQQNNTNTSNGSSNSTTSSAVNNSSSSANTSENSSSNSDNSSNSGSANSSSSSSNSSSSSSTTDNSSSNSGSSTDTNVEIIQEGEEEQIINIVENLDDF